MNENTENTFSEADVSAFDTGWDDEALPFASDAEEAEDTAETETEPAAETETDGENQPAADGEANGEAEQAAENQSEPDTFELKYMGETIRVGRNEVVALAQKGKDYDRIRKERDDMSTELTGLRADKSKLTEYEGFLDRLARSVGMDIPGMMDSTLAKMMVAEEAKKGNTISEDFAIQKIRFEREKADFERQKAGNTPETKKDQPEEKPAEKQAEKPAAEKPADDDAAKAKRNDEANAFLKAYPDVDPKSIPKEVLDKWMAGEPLLYAYMAYENKKLRADNAAAEQNNKNRERSAGSAKSAGAGRKRDAFDEGWDSV